jgi:hypothetical protein
MKNAFKILIGKPDRNRPILIRRPRWEDNIKLDVRDTDVKIWTGYF